MARDCPDRKRGQDWRNDDRGPPRNAPRIGGAEDELDSFLADMGGAGGQSRQTIEYNGGANDSYGGGEEQRTLKPWERGPTGGAAPWARSNRDERDSAPAAAPWASAGAGDSTYNAGGYGAAPWTAAAPAAPAGVGYGYGAYGSTGYDNAAPGAGVGSAPPMGAPPGMNAYGAAPPPPGLGPLFQNYGNAGSPPPPPPPGDVPPPPVSGPYHYLKSTY
jgi:splicing factor 1